MNEWMSVILPQGYVQYAGANSETLWKVYPITRQLLIQCLVIVPLHMSILTLGVLFLKNVKVAVVHLRSILGRWLFGSKDQKCMQVTLIKDHYIGRTQENLTEPHSTSTVNMIRNWKTIRQQLPPLQSLRAPFFPSAFFCMTAPFSSHHTGFLCSHVHHSYTVIAATVHTKLENVWLGQLKTNVPYLCLIICDQGVGLKDTGDSSFWKRVSFGRIGRASLEHGPLSWN